jgi:GPH family glycoside/pentoside/hexuronide:cation symporter
MAESASGPAPAPPLARAMLFAFAMPGLMIGFTHAPEFQVQGIYAKHAALSLAALAGAMLLTRMFDAITFPLIGHLSDLTARRSGSRKPWVLAGAVVTVIGSWLLYHPPADVSIEYFTLWVLVTHVGWKLTEIPYAAWSLGLTNDYVQRARVQVWRALALLVGTTLFYVVPYLAKALGMQEGTDMNFQTLGLGAVAVAIGVPLLNLLAVARVPDGEIAIAARQAPARVGLRELLRAITQNGPLLRLLGAAVPFAFLFGMSTGASYLFVDAYMGLGDKYALLNLLSLPFSLLGLPLWGWMCLKFERHRVWGVSLLFSAASYSALGFVPVGAAGLPLILVLYPATIFCMAAAVVALPAMMGDVVDYGRLQTGEDRAGLYSSILAFNSKSLAGIAGAAGLGLLAWSGFDATAHEQTVAGAFGIRLVVFWLPAAGFALAGLLVWTFPLTRQRQAEIRAALQARADAASN